MAEQAFAEAQVSVLGSMLIDDRCVSIVLASIKPEYFAASHYRRIFQAIKALAAAGRPIDPVTVLDAVGKEYHDLIAQLMDLTPSAKNIREYCRILRREARMNLLRAAAAEMMAAGDEEELRAGLDQINALMVDRPGVKTVNMAEALQSFYERHDPKIQPDYLPMVFPKLTDNVRVSRGDLLYLGGYPSDGKTTLALTMARAQAKTKRVGFYSLETSAEKLTDAMVCAAAKVGLPTIQLNTMNERDWGRVAGIASDFTGRNLEIVEAAGMSVTDIRLHAASRHYDVIYIDYIQLIAASGKSGWAQKEYERVSANSLALKQMGRETGVTIIALSQMTRPEKSKDGKMPPPSMANLRSSGQLEQDADAVLLLFREDSSQSNSDRIITIGKNKTGPAGGSFYLEFNGVLQTFANSARNPGPKPKETADQPQQLGFDVVNDDGQTPWDKEEN